MRSLKALPAFITLPPHGRHIYLLAEVVEVPGFVVEVPGLEPRTVVVELQLQGREGVAGVSRWS